MIAQQGALLAAAQAGNRVAAEQLLKDNDRLIWAIVRRYLNRGAEAEDLFQLGCIGFLKAIDGYDPAYGTQFSTYAVPKIAGEMRRFLRDDGAVKVSRTIKERGGHIYMVRQSLTEKLGREPLLSELAAETGYTIEEIATADTALSSVTSLQAETAEGLTLENVLGDDGVEESMVERIALREAVKLLPKRERMVIELRYFHGLTQEKSAKFIGVSQVQVSRIEKRALVALREQLR